MPYPAPPVLVDPRHATPATPCLVMPRPAAPDLACVTSSGLAGPNLTLPSLLFRAMPVVGIKQPV